MYLSLTLTMVELCYTQTVIVAMTIKYVDNHIYVDSQYLSRPTPQLQTCMQSAPL